VTNTTQEDELELNIEFSLLPSKAFFPKINFDLPRQIGMEKLATKLGIRMSTLSETMRRGTRRLLDHYFEREL
jgi:hypothetical protein